MARIITALILIMATISFSNVVAQNTATFYYQPIEESSPDINGDDRDHGHRMPPAPIFCELNFDDSTINSSSPLLDNIVDYQILDENGDVCLATAPDAEHFFDALGQIPPGTYVLKFIGEGFYLIGTITLATP